MTIIRQYGNPFEIIDRTEDLLVIPNNWGLTQQLGIFGEGQGVATNTISLEKITESGGLIGDRARGQRNNQSSDYVREIRAFPIPHFPLDDYILPEDVQGKMAYGSPERAETLAGVRMRKMEKIRRDHAWTLEAARMQLITSGTVYAPNATVNINYYTEYGVTRTETDFVLGTSTTDIVGKIEGQIAQIQDAMTSGEVITDIVAICSQEFFGKLISHPKVSTAYQYYTSVQEPLRNRLVAGNGLDGRYREFVFAGVRFIENRAAFNGVRLVPAGDAYFLPMGTMDTFRTYFGPANKFDFVNTIGQEAYMFEYNGPKGDKIEIQTETNFINALRRPAVVTRVYSSN